MTRFVILSQCDNGDVLVFEHRSKCSRRELHDFSIIELVSIMSR